MNRLIPKSVLASVVKVFVLVLIVVILIGVYFLGVFKGYVGGRTEAQDELLVIQNKLMDDKLSLVATKTPTPRPTRGEVGYVANWGGPELWDAVNERRRDLGVNTLSQRDELCTLASIRLNELIGLGTLDGHEGFSKLSDERSDLKDIFESYSVVAEFLALGGTTPEETVSLWENTLGHKKLLTGGEYVWGCVYAQDTFSVAIAAY